MGGRHQSECPADITGIRSRDTHQRQRRGPRVVHPELDELRAAGVSLLDPDFDL
jgi:hypothetical protein